MFAGAFAAILLTGTDGEFFYIGNIQLSFPFIIEEWTIYQVFLMDAITYFQHAIHYVMILISRVSCGHTGT